MLRSCRVKALNPKPCNCRDLTRVGVRNGRAGALGTAACESPTLHLTQRPSSLSAKPGKPKALAANPKQLEASSPWGRRNPKPYVLSLET